MAEEKGIEQQKNPIIIIEDQPHYLDLTLGLGLRPLNPNNNALQTPDVNILSNRRQKANIKRGLKRKAAYVSNNAAAFRPFKGHNGNFHDANNNNNDAPNISSLSSTSSSSGISDHYYTNSTPGGHSSDTSSHSSHPHTHLPAANTPTPSSTLKQLTASQQEETPNCSNRSLQQPQLYSSSCNQIQLFPNSRPPSIFPDVVRTQCKEVKEVAGKPPKPNGLMTSQESDQLSQMPCVTTTGNGPKGKTITGFLYKYTKTEVTIVCVCHGASFSPAGFVEHAGGVDIGHPLKHIRVAPFPLK